MITVVSCIVIFMRRAQRIEDDGPNVTNAMIALDNINMEQENLDIPNTTKHPNLLTVGIVNMEQENLDIPIHPHLPYDDLVGEMHSNPVPEHVYGVINQPRS